MSDSKPTIVVVGAGIIGLTIALKLQSSHHHQVLLVSHEWPTSIPGAPTRHSADYASMWAGAHVRPIPATTPQLRREAAWLRTTVAEFERQAREAPWMGVTKCPGVEYLEAPGPDYTQQTAESFARETGLSGYRLHGKHELPEGVQLGFEYDTFCVNSPVYCASLLRLFVAGGGKTLQRQLRSEWEGHCLAPDVRLVINASGTGFGDIKSFPTRGVYCNPCYFVCTRADRTDVDIHRPNVPHKPHLRHQNSNQAEKRRVLELHHPPLLRRRHRRGRHQAAR